MHALVALIASSESFLVNGVLQDREVHIERLHLVISVLTYPYLVLHVKRYKL